MMAKRFICDDLRVFLTEMYKREYLMGETALVQIATQRKPGEDIIVWDGELLTLTPSRQCNNRSDIKDPLEGPLIFTIRVTSSFNLNKGVLATWSEAWKGSVIAFPSDHVRVLERRPVTFKARIIVPSLYNPTGKIRECYADLYQ